ncbi:MAG: methionyl-tRNA formyltransferase [Patescibacteria group bacterium]
MKYLFFGTPKFSAAVLKKLIDSGMPPSGVVSNPDRPVGRKKLITPPPAKVLALECGIPVYQPENLLDFEFQILISKFDFAIVAAYAKIIPQEVINAFSKGIIGVHPSLLPKYRGASPIQSAILNGDKETGVTLYRMDEKIDHGDILVNDKFQMTNSKITYEELEERLAELAGDLLVKILPDFAESGIKPAAQDESQATFTKKFSTQDGFVDLDKDDPAIIYRKVRALNPEPGVWTMKGDKRMKILKAELDSSAGESKLKLKEIQYEGGKPQTLF